MSTHHGQEHAEHGERKPEPRPGASQGGNTTPSQQFSNLSAQGPSRFHAGNSYVQNHNNYYAPMPFVPEGHTPMPHGPTSPTLWRKEGIDALVKALEFPEMSLRLSNIRREHPNTCTWLQDTEEFVRWRNRSFQSAHHGMLRINGVAGAGKSTIMRYAYNSDRTLTSFESIAFFFNARGRGMEKSAEGMFRTLLCQLLEEEPGFFPHPGWTNSVRGTEMEHYKEQGWPLEALKELFSKAVKHYALYHSALRLVCYIDALDECAEDEVRDLLDYFEDLSEDPISSGNFLLCFSSRPYPNITILHCETIVLERYSGHTGAIRKFALSRLLPRYLGISQWDTEEVNEHDKLVSEIIRKSSGVFLWVVLVVAQLRKNADRGAIPQMLRGYLLEIPSALKDLFDTMIDGDDTNAYFVPIVQWTLFAQGRMRAIDLYFAVRFSIDRRSEETEWLRWKPTEDGLRNFILTASKGFLKMTDTNSTSYMPCEFIHDSVREYFLNSGLRKVDPSLAGDVVGASHSRLAQTCRDYLNDPIARQQQLASPSLQAKACPTDSDALEPAPMLAYIRDKGAFLHAEIADRNGILQTGFCVNFDFDTWLLLREYPRHEPGGSLSFQSERVRTMQGHSATPLHIFVDSQMESLVQRDLQIFASCPSDLPLYLDAQCGGLGTALHIAVEHNNTAIIRALVTSGAHVDFQCEHLGTPLDYAILLDRTESVATLLQLGAMTTPELSPHQRRKILKVQGGREPDPDPGATEQESGLAERISRGYGDRKI